MTGEVALKWPANPEEDVYAYYIDYGTESRNYDQWAFVSYSTNAIITGLTPGTKYYFTLTAVDAHGMISNFSPEVSAVATIPPPPAGSTFNLMSIGVEAENYSITFSWKHSSSWNGTGEYVLKQATGTNNLFIEVARTTGTNITIVVQPAPIRWHVTFRNALGESAPSNEIPFPPLFDIAPEPKTPVIINP